MFHNPDACAANRGGRKFTIGGIAVVMLAVLALSGCAVGRQDVSREDWKIREYKGADKDEVVQAAREVLRLADPDEVIFQITADGFTAERRQLSYLVVESGIDLFRFEFTVREKDGVVSTRFDIWEHIERANIVSLGLPVAKVGKPQSRYAYDLFYSRMEYLLKLKDTWQTCKAVGVDTPGRAEELGLASLCGRFSSDLSPPPRSN